jgi:hypothetical protein
VLRFCTNRIAYMRWSEAWMLLAMSVLVCDSEVWAEHPEEARTVNSLAQVS